MRDDIVATGGIEGSVRIIDVGKQTVRLQIPKLEDDGGVSWLRFSEIEREHLFIGSTAGTVYRMDVRNSEIVKQYQGHSDAVMAFAESRAHNVLVSAGDDKQCLVFDL